MRAIDRLAARAGRNNDLIKCPCDLDGDDYTFYIKPLTMVQIVESRKGKKGGEHSDLETSVKLLTLRALDANGVRIYQSDAYDILMRLPVSDLLSLVGAMNEAEQDDEEGETTLDLKSPSEPAKKGKSTDS